MILKDPNEYDLVFTIMPPSRDRETKYRVVLFLAVVIVIIH